MSDEQDRRRDPRADETRQYQPDDDPRSGDPADSTRPMPADRTQQMPGVAGLDDDATAVAPSSGPPGTPPGATRPDGTAVMPAARDWAAQDAAWAGRAAVRPPRPGDYVVTESDWDAVPPPTEPRGRWWMPILIGIVALLLLGLLGWGVYLIAQNSDSEEPAPAPSVSAPVTTDPATTAPTTEPTTTEPTTEPTTTQPTATEVTVPALVGMSQEEAQQALDRRGLNYRLIFRSSTEAPPGTVIDSDPPEGQQVPADTQVTLVIASERRPTTATTTPTDQEPGDDD